MNRMLTVALSAVLAVAGVAGAQTTRPGAPGRGAGGEGAAVLDRLQERLAELNLSDEQKTQVQALKDSVAETVRGMAGELKNLTPDERREKIREAVNVREKLASILTPEQQAKLRAGGGGGAGGRRPQAQQVPSTQPRPGAAGGGGAATPLIGRLKEALARLDLSAEQKTKIDAILADAAKETQQLRQQANGDRAAARDKIQSLGQATREKVDAVLTPEQKQKLAETFRGRPGNRQAAPAAPRRDNDAQTKPSDTAAAKAVPASSQPAVGQAAPAFTLRRLNGNDVTNKTFAGKPLVLAFGSLSSPSFRDRVPKLLDLKKKYSSRANVMVVYTREAHPSDGWQVERNRDEKVIVASPTTDAERLALAKQLRDRFGPDLDVLVDDLADTALNAFGSNADGAVVIAAYGQLVGTQKFTDVSGLPRLIDDALKLR